MTRLRPTSDPIGRRPCSPLGRTAVLALLGLATLSWTTSCKSSERHTQPSDAHTVAAERALSEAKVALAANDPETALNSLDTTAKFHDALPADLRARLDLTFGRANLAFARRERSRNGDGSIIEGCYIDAKTSLKRAARTQIEDPAPLLALAEVESDLGNWSDSERAATEAIRRIVRREGEQSDSELLIEPMLARARARIGSLAALRRAEIQAADEEPAESTVTLANRVLADCARVQGIDQKNPAAYALAATAYRWLGRTDDAMRVLEDGVRSDPSHAQHHLSLQQLYFGATRQKELVGLYRRLAEEIQPRSPDVLWFYGRALMALADAERNRGDRSAADARYDEATKRFAECAALHPGYRANCDIQRAVCSLSKARMALEEGDEKSAEAELTRAYEIAPAIADVDANGIDRYRDGFLKTYRGGVYALGGRFMGRGGGRLAEARRYFRAVTTRHPTWGPAWSNLGLACRDLGTQRERAKKAAEAKDLYEEAYAAYKHAVQYSPQDPRIQNDCGLMLVYHLKREYPYAVARFKKAIDVGTDQLDTLLSDNAGKEETEEVKSKRLFLEEAIGDAWQNWGLIHADVNGENAKAIECFKKAIEFYPYKRRAAAKRLAQLEPASSQPSKQARLGAAPGSQSLCMVRPEPDDAIEEALAKLESNDPEAALDLIEPLLETRASDAEVWFVAGKASLEFAKQRMARKAQGVDANLLDASIRLKKADELERGVEGKSPHLGTLIHIDPAIARIEALVLRGKLREAMDIGRRHLQHVESLGIQFDPAVRARLLAAVADAASRKVMTDFQAGRDPKKDLDFARDILTQTVASIERLSGGRPFDAKKFAEKAGGALDPGLIFRAWANLEEWAKRPVAAIRAHARLARLLPVDERGAAVGAMLAVCGRSGNTEAAQRELAKLRSLTPNDAALTWYSGYAWVLRGNEQRLASKPEAAPAFYARARKDFEKAMQQNPSFAKNAKHWIALTFDSEGWIAYAAKDVQRARKLWLRALHTYPPAAAINDALGKSAKTGILKLGGDAFHAEEFEAGAKLMQAALEALGHDDSDLLNNRGFLLREQAMRLTSDREAQKRAFRASWAAYKRAVALQPDNVRTLNDAALIDAYYLHENAGVAERLLRHAIEVGREQLAEAGENQQALEEAVGDAYMNLGYLLTDAPKPDKEASWNEAHKLLLKSLDYYPKEARASKRHIRRLARVRREARRKKKAASRQAQGTGKGGR